MFVPLPRVPARLQPCLQQPPRPDPQIRPRHLPPLLPRVRQRHRLREVPIGCQSAAAHGARGRAAHEPVAGCPLASCQQGACFALSRRDRGCGGGVCAQRSGARIVSTSWPQEPSRRLSPACCLSRQRVVIHGGIHASRQVLACCMCVSISERRDGLTPGFPVGML